MFSLGLESKFLLTLSLGFNESIAVCAAFIATVNFFFPDARYVASIDDDLSIMTMMSFGSVAEKLYHGLQQQQQGHDPQPHSH